MIQVRQGDLLLTKIRELPAGLKPVKGSIVVRGEATGHAHQLTDGWVFTNRDGLLFLALTKKAELIHQEHKPIKLDKGFYAVIRQREYTSKDMVQLVKD